MTKLKSDKQFTENGQSIGFEEFNYTLENKSENKILISFTRQIEKEENHYLYIAFYNDQETVFVNICVT